MTTKNKVAAGLFAGALAGAVAGMLLAPKPGKETRHDVAIRLGTAKGKAGDRFAAWRHAKMNGCHPQVVETPATFDVVVSN